MDRINSLPVTPDLIGPWDELYKHLLSLGIEKNKLSSFVQLVEIGKQQAVHIGLLLDALSSAANSSVTPSGTPTLISYEAPQPVGSTSSSGASAKASPASHIHEGVHSVNGLKGDVTIASGGGASYLLRIDGPYVTVRKGATWEALTASVPASGLESASAYLGFPVSANDFGVSFEWRLYNETASSVILEGSVLPPFEGYIVSDTSAALSMPAEGELVALYGRFSGAGIGGSIRMDGNGIWIAS